MSQPANLSDESDMELIARARDGDEAARRAIVCRHAPDVYDRAYRVVRNHERAEDLTQETFLRIFGALGRNGPERKPSAWIGRIADNTAIDYVRRKRPDSTCNPFTITPGQIEWETVLWPTPGDTPTAETDGWEFATELERALRRLKPQYRQCFVLACLEERSYDEIADMLDVPLGTVKSRLSRARQELRRMLVPDRSDSSAD